jgi:glycosyltransferase involved in cell wall biosynthesis
MHNCVETNKPLVLVYAEPLLSGSMTFIRTQAEALTSFRPYYISPHQLRNGLPLPTERVVAMRQGEGLGSRLSEIPFKLWGIAPLYVRRLKALKPALLHAHFGPAALRALPLARALKVPLIVTFQGYDATVYDHFARKSNHYSHRVYVRRRKVLESNSALVIAVSNFIRGELIRQGFAGEKIITHYVGVDTALFCPDPAIRREDVVLFVGRLAEKKGCEYLIRAMARVQSHSPKAELVIIGDGPLRADLEGLASERLQRYRFLGFQPPEIIKQWMNRARVFGAPSLRAHCGDAEGYPNAFAEAQAMGLPVVSFNADGVREAVAHGETGWLAPERDCDALSHYFQRLLDNPELSSRMGTAARKYVSSQFNLRAQTAKLEEIYFQVIEGRAKAPLGLGAEETSEVGVAALGS